MWILWIYHDGDKMTDLNIEVHKKVFSIAWGDMDALGHVNNARYFDYFQEARIEWLRQLNISMIDKTGPVVIHVACTFLKPVIYPATVTLRSKIHSLGNSSMMMDHDLYQDEVMMAQGSCKIVWVDYTKNKSVPLPDEIRGLFK
jgi:acyl-CoA thioester hydrolase